MQIGISGKRTFWVVLIVSAVLLSIATTFAQVDDVTLHFIKNQQDKVHEQMMGGTAGNPWQYRILADWMVSYLIRFLFDIDFPAPKANAYVAFRFLQCMLIFISAGVYYKRLGLPLLANLVGLSILAWGMSHSLYNSDLSLNVFFDIAFYLLAAVLILGGGSIWIPLLMIPAAFNRETSALIPLMLIAFAYFDRDGPRKIKPALLYATTGMVFFVAIFFGLRLHYGEQTFLTADGYYPGVGLLVLNITRWVTWKESLITLGLVPVLAVFVYSSWSKTLKIFFWVVVPVWFGVHFIASLVAESRLLLVPQALVFIPGMLFGLTNRDDPEES